MDYYDVLGVRHGAGEREIELAYKGRRAQYHPDRYAGADAETVQWATRRMQEVNEAYAVLTDPARRRRFDEHRAASGSRGSSDDPGRSRAESANTSDHAGIAFTWSDFVALTSLPALETAGRRHFFAPNIPASKLRSALTRYGGLVRGDDVVVLLDDTILGGAERGAIFTNTQIALNDWEAACTRNFTQIESVSFCDSVVRINGQETARFQLQYESPTRLLFAELDDYLTCVRRASSGEATGLGADLPVSELAGVCSRFMGARAFSGHGSCSIWPDIPTSVQACTRFLLGLGANEEIVAVYQSSGVTRTDCFAVTGRGVHAKTDTSWTALPWERLRQLAIRYEFRDGIRCGVVLSDGTRIVCSNARGDGQTFGANLLAALIELLKDKVPA